MSSPRRIPPAVVAGELGQVGLKLPVHSRIAPLSGAWARCLVPPNHLSHAQFPCMTFARITGRRSLRDPVTCFCAQRNGLGCQRRARTAIRADQVIAAREEWSRGPRHNARRIRWIASSPTDHWTSAVMEPSRVLKCCCGPSQPTLPDQCWGSGSSGPLASLARMEVARPVVLSELSPYAPRTSLDQCMPRRNACPVGRARHVQTGCCRLDTSGDDARLRNARSAASSVVAERGDAPVGGAIYREVSWQLSL